jgi:hypothetical protein
MSSLHLAQINVARLKAPLEAPESRGFAQALDHINALAEAQPGFVWRAVGEGFDSAAPVTGEDPQLLTNLSVWESLEALAAFAFRTEHRDFVRRRADWFEPASGPYLALWWAPAETRPDRTEGFARLDHLRAHGPSRFAFDFKTRFPAAAELVP